MKKQGFQAEKAAKSTSQRRMNYCITIGWHIIAGNRTRNYMQIQLVESNLINKKKATETQNRSNMQHQWGKKKSAIHRNFTEPTNQPTNQPTNHLTDSISAISVFDLLLVSCKSLVTRSISSFRTAARDEKTSHRSWDTPKIIFNRGLLKKKKRLKGNQFSKSSLRVLSLIFRLSSPSFRWYFSNAAPVDVWQISSNIPVSRRF